ncbi:hypothetical protein PPL_05197 [Heterostelium album PN500]|uniref:RRM domain-containing protein n=1 Tax=Heterostelium pallidum (strain ATCC 26659 / Pp 5 / PN500) TaxID=670386 RepID=D3B9Q1_HETP5|nr:hypothetical protein PPL_05197 [Heterostelium album PN500]EFA81963.1 hypothetical protein PPL_05197 [Heterostelium album PN500]|eukprot:XP_020434080.1 hypothetical protein PPL_05197 [Heterostelium album PN500]
MENNLKSNEKKFKNKLTVNNNKNIECYSPYLYPNNLVTTVWVTNIDKSSKVDEVLKLFSYCGRVKTIIVKNINKYCKDALVIFENSQSVDTALLLNGVIIGTLPIKVIKEIPKELIFNDADLSKAIPNIYSLSPGSLTPSSSSSSLSAMMSPPISSHEPLSENDDSALSSSYQQHLNHLVNNPLDKYYNNNIHFDGGSEDDKVPQDSSEDLTEDYEEEEDNENCQNVPEADKEEEEEDEQEPDKTVLFLEDILSSGIALSKNALNEAKKIDVGDIGKKASALIGNHKNEHQFLQKSSESFDDDLD